MEPTPIGKRLRQARDAKGWTLAQLSARCRQLPQTISAIETGASQNPRTATVLIIAQPLGIREEIEQMLTPPEANGRTAGGPAPARTPSEIT